MTRLMSFWKRPTEAAKESKECSRSDARKSQRQDHFPESLDPRTAIDQRRVLYFPGNSHEKSVQQPDDKRKKQRSMNKDEAEMSVIKPNLLKKLE